MSQQLPIKQQLSQISNTIGQIKGMVAQQHKQLDQLKQQLSIIGYKIQDPFRQIRQYFELAKTSVTQQFGKECDVFDDEVEFLKDQIDSVTQDKLKIIQTGFQVSVKIRELSQDVGVEVEQLFVA